MGPCRYANLGAHAEHHLLTRSRPGGGDLAAKLAASADSLARTSSGRRARVRGAADPAHGRECQLHLRAARARPHGPAAAPGQPHARVARRAASKRLAAAAALPNPRAAALAGGGGGDGGGGGSVPERYACATSLPGRHATWPVPNQTASWSLRRPLLTPLVHAW